MVAGYSVGYVTLRVDEDVAWLHVAVHDSGGVNVLQRSDDLGSEGQ